MNGGHSLRRRLIGAMLVLAALGGAAVVLFYLHELSEIRADAELLMPGAGEQIASRLADIIEEDFRELAYIFIPLGVLMLLAITLITAWSLRPIRRASHEAAQIDAANLARRIGTQGLPDEVLPLVQAINQTLDHLASAYEAERRFTVDAAHELRTPVAVLQLRLQQARIDGGLDWDAVERDLAQLTRVVGQLLDLARQDRAHRQATRELAAVNIARIAREAAAQLLPLAERQGRDIEVSAPEPVQVLGDGDDLRDLLRHLLDNALTHGRGTVSVRVERAGNRAIVRIVDQGPGVAAALRDSVFDRFRKGSSTQAAGAGLGLSIAREIARAHGGDVAFEDGPGGRLRVELPAPL